MMTCSENDNNDNWWHKTQIDLDREIDTNIQIMLSLGTK